MSTRYCRSKPAVDELDRPRKARDVRTDECDDVVGPVVRLQLDFRKVAVTIVLHELLQFLDLALDHAPGVGFAAVQSRPAACSQRRIGLPCKIRGSNQPLASNVCARTARDPADARRIPGPP